MTKTIMFNRSLGVRIMAVDEFQVGDTVRVTKRTPAVREVFGEQGRLVQRCVHTSRGWYVHFERDSVGVDRIVLESEMKVVTRV